MPRIVRMVTFNMAHGRGLSLYQGFSSFARLHNNLRKISAMFEAQQADVVALQEIDEDSHWNRYINMLDFFRGHGRFPFCLMGVNARREGSKRLCYGNALLSRFPVIEWHNQPFGEERLGTKGFLYAELAVEDHVLCVVNLHLDYRSRDRRIEQIEQLIEFLRRRPHPRKREVRIEPIVLGDFNSRSKPAGDAVRHLFDYLLSHGDYELFPKKARTFPTYWPSAGIDFIFLPRTYSFCSCRVLNRYLSDHRPVLVEFTLPG